MVKINEHLQVLSKKDQRPILDLMESTWGVQFESLTFFGGIPASDAVLLLSEKEKIYLTTRAVEGAPLSQLRVSTIGTYIAEYKGGDLRLSIEGTQLLGPCASKNIVELTALETEQWMKGASISKETGCSGFVLLRHGSDWLGCGKITSDGNILNFVPKTRRINATSLPGTIAE